ncbi:MAG: class II aldolase/adducin family protein, partial [Pseudomonadota bacterium]
MFDPSDIEAKKDALIWSAKRCFDLGLQTNAGGNLSVRLSSGPGIVIKPSGVGFAECSRDNLQVVHLDGTIEPSAFKPSKDMDF